MSTTQPTLADGLASVSRSGADHLPAPVREAFAAERRTLAAGGPPTGTLELGSIVPDAELLAADGTPTSLAVARDGAPVLLVFYRGAWCPYCNLTLRTYEAELAGPLRERGVRILAVSPQRPEGGLAMSEQNALSFPALSDTGNRLADALGIVATPAESTQAAQAELGLVVADANADGRPELPMPTVALLDASGALRFLDVHPDYSTRTEPAAVLAALDAAGL